MGSPTPLSRLWISVRSRDRIRSVPSLDVSSTLTSRSQISIRTKRVSIFYDNLLRSRYGDPLGHRTLSWALTGLVSLIRRNVVRPSFLGKRTRGQVDTDKFVVGWVDTGKTVPSPGFGRNRKFDLYFPVSGLFRSVKEEPSSQNQQTQWRSLHTTNRNLNLGCLYSPLLLIV